MDRSIFKLSGGEKQILAIAAAYISDTDIVVLDEPSSNLDRLYTLRLKDALEILKKAGKTLIIAEHRLYYIKDLIDRVFMVQDGTVEEKNRETFFALSKAERENLGLRVFSEEKLKDCHAPGKGDLRVMSKKVFEHGEYGFDVAGLCTKKGHVMGIIGKNGSGKSTFLNMLLGAEKGQINATLDGDFLDRKKLRENTFLVMQDVNAQLFTESVAEELKLGSAADEEEVERVLEALELTALKDRHPHSLSGGERQRVAIASAILSGRRVLLFDEPTSGMDYKNMMRIAELIGKVKKDRILFVISHDYEFLNAVADYVVDMEAYYSYVGGTDLMKKFLDYGHEKKAYFYIAIALIGLSSLIYVGAFYYGYKLIAGLVEQTLAMTGALRYAVIILVLLILHVLFKHSGLLCSHIFAYFTLGEIRQKLITKLVENPLGETLKHSAGYIRKKLVDAIEEMELLFAHMFPEGIPYVFSFIFTIILIFVIDYRLGLLSLIPLIINMVAMGVMYKNGNEFMAEYFESQKRMSGNIVEYIGGINVIKIFNRKDNQYKKLKDSIDYYREYTLKWHDVSYLPMAIAFAFGPTLTLLALPFGVYMMISGSLSMSKFIFAMMLCFSASASITKIFNFMPIMMQLSTRLSDIEKDFNVEGLQTGEQTIDKVFEIEYRDVCFSYDKVQVINNVSFKIGRGQHVAFVGESGSGKSTLAKLLLHYYDTTAGAIYINGIDIKEIQLENLMDKIAYVSQDNFLFDSSIKENLLVGKPDATEEEIVSACKAARIHTVIEKLESGYNTRVGESGSKLSGGERQRICIARAILKDADIVVLDEATSFTDPKNEFFINEAIEHLTKGKILITIAHKLSTIKNSDCIMLIDKGNLLASGGHEALLANKVYRRLWHRFKGAKEFSFSVKEGKDD
ncbi:MAG: ATP-binding cassette domain-containing protein [Tissierellia bacterium]|nr:ATP-binding cassette domain-containing protein [Tissierellia bacterium]